MRLALRVITTLAALVSLPMSSALASFHVWKIDEVYSNASGTVQYIELSDTDDGETLLAGRTFTSSGRTFTFPSNLPVGTATAGHHLLLATAGYFNLKGVPPADYNLGSNGFFNSAADTLAFRDGAQVLDSTSFTAGQVPTDGLNALVRSSPGAALTTGVNSPTNVGGASGSFPPWENQNNRLDVNVDSKVDTFDPLQIKNRLLQSGVQALSPPTTGNSPPPFLDVNGDHVSDSFDQLELVNFLIEHPPSLGGAITLARARPLAVPEPSPVGLMLWGLFSLVWFRSQLRPWSIQESKS